MTNEVHMHAASTHGKTAPDLTPDEAMVLDHMREHRDVEEGRADYAKHRDLTPAEARAEIKAFMGEGWTARTEVSLLSPGVWVEARREDAVLLSTNAHPTYRAAVSALLQAWRDAVRPWVREASNKAFDEGCDYIANTKYVGQQARIDRTESRVLKESDHE